MNEKFLHTNDDWAYANPEDIKKFIKTDLVIRIENALKDAYDEKTALKMKDLKQRIGSKNERKIRDTIVEMDLYGGYTIIGTPDGYFNCCTLEAYKKWHDFNYSYIDDISHRVKVVGENVTKLVGEKAFQEPLPLKFN